ncbi:hypothetical protein KY342_00115, partial [Candidatus Woesearchaeota archaeon]|nr:hypothetical protein [Candidatus Woesearchaeota archaeon]
MERDRQEKKEKKKKKMKKIYLILALSIFMISFASAADWDNIMNYNEDSDTIKITNMFGLGKDLAMAQLEDNFCNEGRWCEADKEITLYKEGILIEDFKTLRIDDGSYDEQNIRWHKLEYFGIIEDFNNKCNTKTTFNKINNTYYNNTICEYIKVGEHNGWIEFKEGDIFESGTYKVRTTGEIKPGRV